MESFLIHSSIYRGDEGRSPRRRDVQHYNGSHGGGSARGCRQEHARHDTQAHAAGSALTLPAAEVGQVSMISDNLYINRYVYI